MKKRIVSLVLVFVLVLGLLPGSVMAAWLSFRGNDSNMGITDVQTPAPDYAKLQWAAKIGTSAEGMTTSTVVYAGQPVVEGEFVYATAGRTLYKIKALDGSVAVQQVMDGKDRFGTIPPTIAGDTIYVALDGGMVEAFNKDTLAKKWTLGGLSAGGQNSCPVLVSEGRVYTGFYDSETGTQNYVCLTTAGKRVWSYANAGGFYWAGAVAVGDYIFVGTDDGEPSGASGTSRILSFRKDETRENPVPQALELQDLGDQRSSLAYSEQTGRIYFTTKGGYLCSAKVDGTTGTLTELRTCLLGMGSTSTPVYYKGYVYVGTGTGPGPSGGFAIVKENAQTGDLTLQRELTMPGSTQGSPLLSTAREAEGYLYFYECANYKPGGLICIRVNANRPESTTASDVFTIFDAADYPEYCAASPVCGDDGTIYYKNDSGYLFAVAKTQAPAVKFTRHPQSAAYAPGKTAQALTVAAVAADNAALSYQWEKSSDEKSWTAIEHATTSSYVPEIPAKIEGEQVTYYRCKVTSTLNGQTAWDVSHTAAITVKALSANTTISYIVTDGNEEPTGAPTAASVSETTVVLNYAELGAKKPRVWFQPPQGGTLRVTLGTCDDPAARYDGSGDYTDRVYFRSGITGTNIIRVTATAEDGVTQTTYTFVLTLDGNYDGLRSVYVTITDQGSVVAAQKKLSVDDRNGDGKITNDDVLRAVHAKYCPDGVSGYQAADSEYGAYITRFWGKDTSNTGYWNGGRMCMGLGEEVSDGDHFVAMAYVKSYPDTESYAKFGKFSYTAPANAAVSISLETVTGYDASYNPVFGGCEGAELTAYRATDGATGEALESNLYTVAETGNGYYTVAFSQAGEYYLVAANEEGTIVPAVCTISVSDGQAPGEEVTVTFSLLGDEAHGAGETAHTLKGGNLTTWIDKASVTVPAGATVLDVIEKAFVAQEDPTYSWKGDPGYIRSVTRSVKGGTTTTLAEGSNGTNSGWMYTFNGVHTNKAANEQVVGDGDKIVLHYTDDYTLEAGMVYTPADVVELIDAIGEVTRLSGPAIDAARSAYDSLTDEEKAQVTNYKTLLDAEEAFRNLSSSVDWRTAYRETGTKLLDLVLQGKWTTGSVGGEWMMLGLARSERLYGGDVEDYIKALESFVKGNINASGQIRRNGDARPTENARVALAVSALGYDARSFAGYDLLAAMKNTAWVTKQGNNASAFALLAMNAKTAYLAGDEELQRAAETLVKSLVDKQNPDGGWANTKGNSDLDTTAMALTALAAYRQDNRDAADAITLGLSYLAGQQLPSGAIGTTAETTAQALVALSTLGIDAATDAQFSKDGKNVLDGLLQYYLDGGGFYHAASASGYNQMASEQAYYALAAYARLASGNAHGLYDMDDAKKLDDAALEDVLREIEALGEITDASRETYVKLETIRQKIRYLKDEDKKTAQDALEEKQSAFDEILAEKKQTARTVSLSKVYDAVIDAARKEDPSLLTDAALEEVRKVMAQAEKDIRDAAHTGEIGDILAKAKTDMENALHTMKVSFRLIGDFLHEEQGDEHKDYVTWIQTKTYSLSAGATVKDLLEKALDETGLQETGADDGYVSAILAPEVLGGYWLSEMDNGANSGWMYTVNGKHPDQALNDFTLEAGDKVIWHYVDDYTTEADAETWLKAADISPEEYAKQKLARIVQVIGGGTVEPSLGFSQLGADVTFTFEPDTNQQLLEVTVDGKSIGTPESYTYKNLTLNSRIVATFTGAMLFLDVRREDWFYSDVRYVVEHGLFHGTTQDLFSPNAPMTRGMLVTVLYRLAGSPKATENSGFADVAAGKYYTDAVAWAAESGIVSGVSDGCFAPDSRVTREQLAAILYRYARDKRYDTGKTAELTGFADYEQISGYAAEALGWTNAEGLVSGRSKAALSPQGSATRAEVAAILHRFAENVAK